MGYYTASCNPPKGVKKGYTVNYRHPVVKDKDNKYGLRIQKGLGTRDEAEAQGFITQLNELLSNEVWWDYNKREDALKRFDEIVVNIFYEPMQDSSIPEEEILSKIMLPGKIDGYKYGVLLGPSGVGKTTLLRYLCGTIKEKFPTTSTGRTTTCNMEVIMSDKGLYECVITFMSRLEFSIYVLECIEEACRYCVDTKANKEIVKHEIIMNKLLNHKDLIIRLSYILGEYLSQDSHEYDEYDEDDELIDSKTEEIQEKYSEYIESIMMISDGILESKINIDEYDFTEDELAEELCGSIVDEVQRRFKLLENGEKITANGKWINGYYYTSDNREEFIDIIKRFTSNNKYEWGKLLSPLVTNIRVKGDFRPEGYEKAVKMVLFDGQGLGHKTTATSVPFVISEKYKKADAIIIVDNATSPMLANAKLAVKDVITSGFAEKIFMCYTHIDEMQGENFARFNDKREHIVSALSAYLSELRKSDPLVFSGHEETMVIESCYYFSELDSEVVNKITRKESEKLFEELQKRFSRTFPEEKIVIEYDEMTLYNHMQIAMDLFRKDWNERIGYPYRTQRTEHWSRIKALSNRLANTERDNYNNELAPLSDLKQRIQEQLNLFMNKPMNVNGLDTIDEKVIKKINLMKGEINDRFIKFIRNELWKDTDQLNYWKKAYAHGGIGSTIDRRNDINFIFDKGAPKFGNFIYEMDDQQKKYVTAALSIVEDVLETNGCKLQKFRF